MASTDSTTPAPPKPVVTPETQLFDEINALLLADEERSAIMKIFQAFKEEKDVTMKAYLLRKLRRITTLPWGVFSPENDDVAKAKAVLDASHTGMEKVKKRIYDFIAVRKANEDILPPVLCIYGAEGIGKATIAKSIANALGRKFAKVSFVDTKAPVKDGNQSLGLILQAMKSAGTMNPVILLEDVEHVDRIHELGLIEAIDPNLRETFVDASIGVPFDLSEVFFIASWSSDCCYRSIPRRLFPMVEFIYPHPEGYTPNEKMEIAKNHLIGKNMAVYSLTPDSMKFEESALEFLIDGYTYYDWGVQVLNKKIDALCRAIAVKRMEAKNSKTFVVTEEFLEELFGEAFKPYPIDHLKKRLPIGVSFVLYTAGAQGSVEIIELTNNRLRKGTNADLKVTGLVSTVIKESCRIAFSYLNANAKKYKLDEKQMNQGEIHVHLPRGASYKCGPSAGCAFMLTFYSFFSGRHIRADSVVTGEVTLSGSVTAIGGINRKAYGAYRQGFRRIVLPKENEYYVKEKMDPMLKREMEVVFVSNIDELFEQMMEKEVPIPFSKL